MAPKPRTSSAPPAAKIDDLRHPADVTRRNIPTAETESLMAEEEAAPAPKLYPRNPDLDPQLVWHGKDELDAVPLRVPTVPIYIQEKVLPAALMRWLTPPVPQLQQPTSRVECECRAMLSEFCFAGQSRICLPIPRSC